MPPSARHLGALALVVVAACGPASSSDSQVVPAAPDSQPSPTSPAVGAAMSPSSSPAADQPAPERLATTQTSGFTEPAELVLRDAGALAEAWRTLHAAMPAGPAPAVDFAREMVVLVALGERPSGGHEVRIDGVEAAGGGATVRYTATRPGASCMTAAMMTAPAAAVRTPRVDGAVRFERRDVVQEC